MIFKTKLRRIGNSIGIIIPKNVITSHKIGDEITLNVITSESNLKVDPLNNMIQPNINSPKDVKNWHKEKFNKEGKFITYFK